MIKKITYIILTVIILGGSIFLVSFAGIEHRRIVYRAFNLEIINPQKQPLVNEEELLDTLATRFGSIEGREIDAVPVYDIEVFLTANPYVASTNVYTTLNGDMVASVTARVPLVRVINSYDESFLVDTAGVVMPLSRAHPVRLLVATGSIDARPDTLSKNIQQLNKGSITRQVFEISRIIYKDEFLRALIGQVFVNENREIELLPKIGDQVIIMGSSENAENKLTRLKEFYIQVMKYAGWDTYQAINLTFDNQVVCTK